LQKDALTIGYSNGEFQWKNYCYKQLMTIMKITYEIIVRGRVQGVGYRWFVKRQADLFGITGYVKNQVNGSVLIIAQGYEEQLDAFIRVVKKGPDFALITSAEINLLTSATEYKDFLIAA